MAEEPVLMLDVDGNSSQGVFVKKVWGGVVPAAVNLYTEAYIGGDDPEDACGDSISMTPDEAEKLAMSLLAYAAQVRAEDAMLGQAETLVGVVAEALEVTPYKSQESKFEAATRAVKNAISR